MAADPMRWSEPSLRELIREEIALADAQRSCVEAQQASVEVPALIEPSDIDVPWRPLSEGPRDGSTIEVRWHSRPDITAHIFWGKTIPQKWHMEPVPAEAWLFHGESASVFIGPLERLGYEWRPSSPAPPQQASRSVPATTASPPPGWASWADYWAWRQNDLLAAIERWKGLARVNLEAAQSLRDQLEERDRYV